MSEHPGEVVDLPVLDEPPKGDYWAPEVLEVDLTPEEIALGNTLGEVIDPDDDEDNGQGLI